MLKIAHSSIYAHPLPEGHRFPMLKYELIPEQLLHEGSITAKHLFVGFHFAIKVTTKTCGAKSGAAPFATICLLLRENMVNLI